MDGSTTASNFQKSHPLTRPQNLTLQHPPQRPILSRRCRRNAKRHGDVGDGLDVVLSDDCDGEGGAGGDCAGEGEAGDAGFDGEGCDEGEEGFEKHGFFEGWWEGWCGCECGCGRWGLVMDMERKCDGSLSFDT